METNTTAVAEVVDNGELRDRLGRMITPRARRAALVAAWRASGVTQAAFARSEGIRYTTFCSWVQDRRTAEGERPSPMRAARRAARSAAHRTVQFAQVQVPTPSVNAPALEVELPDGTVIRGERAEEVAKLLKALRR